MLISELGMAVSQLALGIYFHSLAQILEGATTVPPLPTASPPAVAAGHTTLPGASEGSTEFGSLFNSTQRQEEFRLFKLCTRIWKIQLFCMYFTGTTEHVRTTDVQVRYIHIMYKVFRSSSINTRTA
jgi:hypothetical protein